MEELVDYKVELEEKQPYFNNLKDEVKQRTGCARRDEIREEEAYTRDFASVPVVWEPKEDSEILTKKLMKRIEDKYEVKISDCWDLHKWSVENLDKFWDEMWHFGGIIYSKPYHQVIDLNVPMGEFHEWFAGAKLNFAENLLRYRDDHVALILAGEDRETEKVTYSEMYEEAKLYAASLRKQGVKKGDIVSCYMSNRKEAIFAMIATTSIGAIWVGAVPLSGSQAVLNRLTQVNPIVLFTVDRFQHNKEEKDMLPKLKDIANGLPSLQKVIIVASKPESKYKDITGIRNSCFLEDFLETGKNPDESVPEMEFEQVEFTYPIFISHTSGTTGLPKVLVHHCGALMNAIRDFWMQNDSDRNACWYSMSPVGWYSWNMCTTMLFLGLKLVMFEGSPYFLSPTFFWDMVEELRITHVLMVNSALDNMEKRGYIPREGSRPVKFLMSGGGIVKPQIHDFAYEKINCEIFLSFYGSTECSGTVMFYDQTQKIYKGEISGPSLGMDWKCLDEEGKSVVGALGELVICKPYPALISGIWGDTDRSIFKKSYCGKYPGKFNIGDLVLINPETKGIVIHGRSDATLNPRGLRFGSSDIYCVVDTFPEISDSICVSHYNKNNIERIVLFLKMKKGCAFEESLVKRLRATIAEELSTSHVPEVIMETSDIPHSINGKKLESVVKKIINKMPFSSECVANPECLENFFNLPELGEFT